MKTTAEMIEVMQAYDRGEKVEIGLGDVWKPIAAPVWNWFLYDFRIAPKPLEFRVILDKDNNPLRIGYLQQGPEDYRSILVREVI